MKRKGTTFTKTIRLSALALCALSLGGFLPSTVGAEPFGTNLTLQAALDYGAENNPQLKSTFQQWKGVEYNISVQKALPDPMLTYGYFFESVETRVGPQNQSFGLSQKFPGFGKRSAMKSIATDMAAAVQQRYRREKLNLDFSIAQAYAELYYLKRSIGITRDRIDLIRNLEEVARQRYASGSSMAPVLQAQVELGRLEDQFNSLKDMQHPREATLNALLNRPTDSPLPISSILPYRSITADAATLGRNLSHTSPELQELAAKVDQGSHQLQLARRERLPDFTLGVVYIDTGSAVGAIKDSGKDPVIGTVGINLPLWIGKNRARIESASYLKTAARLSMENRAQTLDADIRQALFKLRDADRKINLYKESLIPKANQSLQVNRQGYEAGKMEFINLIDAERMLLEFLLSHERALADHLIARAHLSKLTGIDFLTGEINHEGTKNTKAGNR
jgi:cobalt-zinc-cadmium efflux system outer membrane protein